MNRIIGGLLFCSLFLFQPVHGQCADSKPGYEVEGTLMVTNYLNGDVLSRFRYDFFFAVQGAKWFFRVDDPNMKDERGNSLTHRNEYGCEGNDIYAFSIRTPTAQERSQGKTNIVQGSASPGPVPLFEGDRRLLWMAFASGGYLEQEPKPNWKPPWHVPDVVPRDYFRFELVRHKIAPGLPEEMIYRGPSYTIVGSGKKVDHPPVFKDGFIAGDFHVKEWTNFGGLDIPLGFTMTRSIPRRDATAITDLNAIQTWLAQVMRVGELKRTVFLPVISQEGEIQILDYRFRDASLKLDELRYKVGDKKWHRTNDPMVKQLSENQQQMTLARIEARKKREPKRLTAMVCVALVAGVPLLFLIIHASKRKS